ncbi:MAG: 4Fe-4S dicluster domain-containing protein [Phycisphaerae bacterium]|nr:4Fe-4S dicluster domain-containing protein [Phycisphaerae bacterium]
MLFQRFGKFDGGIDLPEEKEATIDEPIRPAEGLSSLRVPLSPCGGAVAVPTVGVGTQVAAGQQIAAGRDGGVDIFTPLAGTVKSITTAAVAVGREQLTAPAVELTDLGHSPPIPEGQTVFAWTDADSDALAERIAEGQLTTLRAKPQPLVQWLADARAAGCDHLIVNAIQGQPFVTADHRLLVEHGADIVAGLAILAKAAGIPTVTIAVDQQRVSDYPELLSGTAEYSINRVALPRKYPISVDNILLEVLTRKEVPCGGKPGDIGIAVIDAATCFAAYRWVACSQRLNGRVVTVSGERTSRPGNWFTPYGADCRVMARADEDGPVILGGPMIGQVAADGAVTSPGVDAVLATDPTPPGTPVQCIRCGWCRDHCPARLNVAMLNDHYELGHVSQAERLGALSCVECGVCSYVCPARLPLTERVRQLKSSIRRWRQTMPLFQDVAEKQGDA